MIISDATTQQIAREFEDTRLSLVRSLEESRRLSQEMKEEFLRLENLFTPDKLREIESNNSLLMEQVVEQRGVIIAQRILLVFVGLIAIGIAFSWAVSK